MGLAGADIDQMRVLARTLTQAAERLEGYATTVTGMLSALPWSGPDGERFRSQWHGESQARVRGVVAALREASNIVAGNADEQEQASSVGSGSAASGSINLPAQWGQTLSGISGEQPLNPLVGIRDFLNSNAVWPITWGTLLGPLDDHGALGLLDAIGLANDSRLSPEEKIGEAANSLAGVGAGLLKGTKTPVGYLSGVALAQWTDVATLVAKADFTPSTIKTVTDYIGSNPGGAFDAAKDAVVGYVPKLFSNLVPW